MNIIANVTCQECGEPLIVLGHKTAVCPKGHGKIVEKFDTVTPVKLARAKCKKEFADWKSGLPVAKPYNPLLERSGYMIYGHEGLWRLRKRSGSSWPHPPLTKITELKSGVIALLNGEPRIFDRKD